MDYIGILKVVLPYMSFAFIGGACNRFGITRGKPEKFLMKLQINFLIPLMVVNYVVGNPALVNIGNVISAPLVGFYGIAVGCAVSWGLAAYFGARTRDAKASFAFTTGIYNYGFMSIPIVEAMLGKDTVGLLLVHNMGIDLAYWSVGIAMIAGFSGNNIVKLLKTPPLIAIVASLCINFFMGENSMPKTLAAVIHPFAVCAVPLGIFISGATLAESAGSLFKKGWQRICGGSVLLRLVVIPLIMVYSVKYFPVNHQIKMITAVQAAMPAGMLSVVIVKYFSGDIDTAVQTIISTTAVSLVTIPFCIGIFSAILS